MYYKYSTFYMYKTIIQSHNFFFKENPKNYILIIILNLCVSIIQIFSVGSIFALTSLLINTDIIFESRIYKEYFPFKDLSTNDQVIFFSFSFIIFLLLNYFFLHLTSIYQRVTVEKLTLRIRLNLFEIFF